MARKTPQTKVWRVPLCISLVIFKMEGTWTYKDRFWTIHIRHLSDVPVSRNTWQTIPHCFWRKFWWRNTNWYNFDTVLYYFLETGTSDRCLICIVQNLRFSGFSLYPLSFFLYSPFKYISRQLTWADLIGSGSVVSSPSGDSSRSSIA